MTSYLQLLLGAALLMSFYSVFKMLVFNMHMFQLNGYRCSKHFHWLKKNISRYAVELVCFALSFTGLVKSDALMGFCAAALLVCIIALAPENKSRPAKKPLVYTPRVKRMLVTFCVLYTAVFVCIILLLAKGRGHLAFMVTGLANALAPMAVLLANLINTPIEKDINRHYLNDAKRMLRECPSLETIGITGSYGKTGVKFYLYDILKAWTDTLVTPNSFNTPMGVVKTVRGSLKATHRIFLCEMGAMWTGDIKELCDIVNPRHGIITALGEQHLETFGSKENIIKTKYELADALPSDGRLYLNWDNETIRLNPPKHKYIRYGTHIDADYRAFNIRPTAEGTEFDVAAPGGVTQHFVTKLLGEHNVINLTGAIAAANGFGMPLSEMPLFVRRIDAVPHRMQIVPKGAVTIIDDAFNSNPAGCRAALSTLRDMDGMRILVTPGMVELGEREDELNRQFGEYAAECCDKIVLVGAKQTLAIKQGIESKGAGEKISVYENFNDAIKAVYALKTDKKKIVLLENDLPDNY